MSLNPSDGQSVILVECKIVINVKEIQVGMDHIPHVFDLKRPFLVRLTFF